MGEPSGAREDESEDNSDRYVSMGNGKQEAGS